MVIRKGVAGAATLPGITAYHNKLMCQVLHAYITADLFLHGSYRMLKSQTMFTGIWVIFSVIVLSLINSRLLFILIDAGQRHAPFDTVQALVESDYVIYGSANMKMTFAVSHEVLQQLLVGDDSFL